MGALDMACVDEKRKRMYICILLTEALTTRDPRNDSSLVDLCLRL